MLTRLQRFSNAEFNIWMTDVLPAVGFRFTEMSPYTYIPQFYGVLRALSLVYPVLCSFREE